MRHCADSDRRTRACGWSVLLTLMLFTSCLEAAPDFRSERLVTVQPGETLSEIVEREMRSAVYWPAVARHNNIQDPRKIQQGQKIRIPLTYTRSQERAIVLFVKGTAFRRSARTKHKEELHRGDEIKVGDEIFTGQSGFVSVEFSSGSVINIQPSSHITIVDIDCEDSDEDCAIELYTEEGSVQSRVNASQKQPVRFRINTPSGSAAVRGTVFDMDSGVQESSTSVTRGQVDLSAEGITAELNQGFGAKSRIGEPPGIPTLLLQAPVFRNVPARLAAADSLHWWGDPEAKRYLVQISEDELATRVRKAEAVDENRYEISLDRGGKHYILLRAIDSNGLKGMPATKEVNLVTRIDSAERPRISGILVDSDAGFNLDAGVPGAVTYEMQISSDPEFVDVRSVDLDVGQGAKLSFADSAKLWGRARAVYPDFKVGPFSQVIEIRQANP